MSYPRGLDEYSGDELAQECLRRLTLRLSGQCDYCERPLGSEPACRFPERHEKTGFLAKAAVTEPVLGVRQVLTFRVSAYNAKECEIFACMYTVQGVTLERSWGAALDFGREEFNKTSHNAGAAHQWRARLWSQKML